MSKQIEEAVRDRYGSFAESALSSEHTGVRESVGRRVTGTPGGHRGGPETTALAVGINRLSRSHSPP